MSEFEETFESSIPRTPSDIGRLAEKRNTRSSDSLDESVADDLPCCRICQCTQVENPTSKLIRPCKCSGSLSYVHVSCLNTWRATSENANYQCSICGYKYIIQRTTIANMLLSEYAAKILTGFIVFVAGLLLGVFLKLVSRRFGLDTAGLAFNLLGFVPWWRTYRPWTDIFTFNYTHDSYYALLLRFDPQALFCNKMTSDIVDVVVLGISFIGSIGFAMFVIREIRRLREIGGPDGNNRVFIFGIWLCSVGNRVLGRLCFFIGTAVACSEVYFGLLEYCRKYAQSLGEQILEPHFIAPQQTSTAFPETTATDRNNSPSFLAEDNRFDEEIKAEPFPQF